MNLTVLTSVTLFVIAIGVSAAYAEEQETLTFRYSTENLVTTNTWNVTQTLENNYTEQSIFAEWIYLYPPGERFDPRPVIADPVGKFFELLLVDTANIFKPIIEPIHDTVEALKDVMVDLELIPEPKHTHEEQKLIDDVYLYCEKLNERLTAIGRAFDFEYESDEFYVKFPTKAKMHSEDCRGRLHLGNNVLSSMYEALKEEAKADAEDFANIKSTDVSRKSDADYSVSGDMWDKRAKEAFDYAKDTLVKDYGYGQTYDKNYQGDPVVATNDNSPTDRELKIAKLEQKKLADDLGLKAACETYWSNSAGYGGTATSGWKLELSDGTCDGRILDYVDENNVIYYLNTTQIFLDKQQAEIEELEALREGRELDSEDIKQKQIEKAQAEYERLTTIPKTNSTNGTGN